MFAKPVIFTIVRQYATSVGIDYSLPISRRLNLDFTLGVGYWGGEYHEYIPSDGHYVWQSTKQRHWFGPTKAACPMRAIEFGEMDDLRAAPPDAVSELPCTEPAATTTPNILIGASRGALLEDFNPVVL